MPVELKKAHVTNDKAVMQAYGFSIKDTTEADCVEALMKLHQKLIEKNKNNMEIYGECKFLEIMYAVIDTLVFQFAEFDYHIYSDNITIFAKKKQDDIINNWKLLQMITTCFIIHLNP